MGFRTGIFALESIGVAGARMVSFPVAAEMAYAHAGRHVAPLMSGQCAAFAWFLAGECGCNVRVCFLESRSYTVLVHAWCELPAARSAVAEELFADIRGVTSNGDDILEPFAEHIADFAISEEMAHDGMQVMYGQFLGPGAEIQFANWYGGLDGTTDFSHSAEALRMLKEDFEFEGVWGSMRGIGTPLPQGSWHLTFEQSEMRGV